MRLRSQDVVVEAQPRKVFAKAQYMLLLFSCDAAHYLTLEADELRLQVEQPLHHIVPALLERAGNQAIAAIKCCRQHLIAYVTSKK
jgi:hypothetical protein